MSVSRRMHVLSYCLLIRPKCTPPLSVCSLSMCTPQAEHLCAHAHECVYPQVRPRVLQSRRAG